MKINAFAAQAPKTRLDPFPYAPAELGSQDIEVKITHCGICHSDLHLIDNDWGIWLSSSPTPWVAR